MPVWLARVWDSLANPQSWNFPPERFSMLSLHHCGGVKQHSSVEYAKKKVPKAKFAPKTALLGVDSWIEGESTLGILDSR